MSRINLIVAMDEKRGIGKNNALLCHLPADLKHFKTLTLGKPIIMGYHTYQSIGKPLPGRLNIVLSRQQRDIEGVTVVHSLQDALQLTQDYDDVMIIGGESVFKQALPLANRIYLTVIHHQFAADVFFPEFDLTQWHRIVMSTKQHDETNQYDMTFYQYDRLP